MAGKAEMALILSLVDQGHENSKQGQGRSEDVGKAAGVNCP